MATSARLEVRISAELHALIKHAAERAVEEIALLRLEVEDQQQFASSLLEERATQPNLLQAMARRNALGE